jgi:hypothetical protein
MPRVAEHLHQEAESVSGNARTQLRGADGDFRPAHPPAAGKPTKVISDAIAGP